MPNHFTWCWNLRPNRIEPIHAVAAHDRGAPISQTLWQQRPFGENDWQAELAAMFGLASTLRELGSDFEISTVLADSQKWRVVYYRYRF
jgi:hypothetical protein